MGIENAILQDLESVGKEDFQICYGKVWVFGWKKSKNILKWM